MKEVKSNKNLNINQAKDMFFECQGSMMHLDREFPQYRGFKISPETEKIWKEEIISKILLEIKHQTGIERTNSLNKLSNIYESDAMIQFLYDHLEMSNLDGYSKIICLEILKKMMQSLNIMNKYNKLNQPDAKTYVQAIKDKINLYKNNLSHQEITIDESYKDSYLLKYYDFSQENLKKRIEQI